MSLEIQIDDLQSEAVIELLAEHHEEMNRHSPPESVHALSISELQAPDVTFWSAWKYHSLAGCGALKALGNKHGEIKSMRTSTSHKRLGVASQILDVIIAEARMRGYNRLSLETGSMAVFTPACRLYERFGFSYCEPFADYQPDPNSLFMTRQL